VSDTVVGQTGKALVEHPLPGLVSITRSVRAGISVAVSAAQQLKRAHLELGGKAPVVVFADADIEVAADGIAAAGFFNAGQDCAAATRVIVAELIHDQFVQALVAKAKAKASRPGDRDDEDAAYGPLNNVTHFAKVCSVIAELPDHATVAAGGNQFGTEGLFFEPTVVTGLHQDDQAIQEEIFGPVITVQSFTDETDALTNANGVPYGLSPSVWTRDHATALRMSRDLNFGCVWINTHIPPAAEMPHGGFGQSGYGKDLSGYGLEDYTRVKHVMSSLD
jgi:betaine-aldehyde dehydrogenase